MIPELFQITFAASGVTTWIFLPPLVTFFLGFFGAMAGITGAFLLLPFQMSVLNYVSPAVSATNLLYNLWAIPGALWRYIKEGRMNWPLALVMTSGTVPGMFGGYLLRVFYLPDPRRFKALVGGVLLYLAGRLLSDLLRGPGDRGPVTSVETVHMGLSRIVFEYGQKTYSLDPRPLFLISLVVGLIGGAYGIGGGAILSPFCVAVLKVPVYAVASASLFTTLMSSIAGVIFYTFGPSSGPQTRPDWLLAALFGLGGLLGTYLGARAQRYIPERPIKLGLMLVVLTVGLRYLFQAFPLVLTWIER
ncbi:sulfite exporter TauE/SafE family protein [Thermosulfuriphilus sp.]